MGLDNVYKIENNGSKVKKKGKKYKERIEKNR